MTKVISVNRSKRKAKGVMEDEISKTIVHFEKEYMGRGPTEVKTYIVDDMIIVRLKGVLTKAERQLSKTVEGVELVKKVRSNLLESVAPILYKVIKDITGIEVLSFHTDISIDSGERIIIFMMSERIVG